MTSITDRTCFRALFGSELRHNQDFLHNLKGYNFAMGIGTLVGQLPPGIRPIAGWLTNPLLRFYKARASRTLVPVIEKQMLEFRKEEADGTLNGEEEMTDFLSQAVRLAMVHKVCIHIWDCSPNPNSSFKTPAVLLTSSFTPHQSSTQLTQISAQDPTWSNDPSHLAGQFLHLVTPLPAPISPQN